MPIDSTIGRAIRRAEHEATKRGHTLGAWGFMHGQAANRCERDGCSCSVLVTPGAKDELLGAAIVLGCKEDGNAWLDAPEPQPSGPDAIEAPLTVAPSVAPTDAPWEALETPAPDRRPLQFVTPAKRRAGVRS